MFNIYILYCKIMTNTARKDEEIGNFRMNIVEEILAPVSLLDCNVPGRPSHSDVPTRLRAKRWGHFP